MCLLQRRKDRDVFKVCAYTTNLVQFGHEVQETKMDKTILRNPPHSLGLSGPWIDILREFQTAFNPSSIESCGDNKKVCCIQKLVRLRPFDYRGALFRSSLPSGAVLYYKQPEPLQYDLATKSFEFYLAEKEQKPNQIRYFLQVQ